MRSLAAALALALAGCLSPPVWPVNPPAPPPAPVPPQPPPEPVADAKWDAYAAIEARAVLEPVTEAEVTAALGKPVLPAAFTQPRVPFDRVVTYAVRSKDGASSLRAHVHFREGKAVAPFNLE